MPELYKYRLVRSYLNDKAFCYIEEDAIPFYYGVEQGEGQARQYVLYLVRVKEALI